MHDGPPLHGFSVQEEEHAAPHTVLQALHAGVGLRDVHREECEALIRVLLLLDALITIFGSAVKCTVHKDCCAGKFKKELLEDSEQAVRE